MNDTWDPMESANALLRAKIKLCDERSERRRTPGTIEWASDKLTSQHQVWHPSMLPRSFIRHGFGPGNSAVIEYGSRDGGGREVLLRYDFLSTLGPNYAEGWEDACGPDHYLHRGPSKY